MHGITRHPIDFTTYDLRFTTPEGYDCSYTTRKNREDLEPLRQHLEKLIGPAGCTIYIEKHENPYQARGVNLFTLNPSDDMAPIYAWKVYPAGTSRAEIEKDFPDARHGGPGQAYTEEVWLLRMGTRVLARQTWGMNV